MVPPSLASLPVLLVMGRRGASQRTSGIQGSGPVGFAGLAAFAAAGGTTQRSPHQRASALASSSSGSGSMHIAGSHKRKIMKTTSAPKQSEHHVDQDAQVVKRRADMTDIRGIRRADP